MKDLYKEKTDDDAEELIERALSPLLVTRTPYGYIISWASPEDREKPVIPSLALEALPRGA
ncbi:MAG: hypothetical protein RDV48_22015 [Candidatus Eremiobacteraeota bacterium]|nr:hypothetical protein [Candidatus Eremiobacteraeota bacterium]